LTAIVAVLLLVLVVGSLAAAISFERMAQNDRRSTKLAQEAGRRADEAYRDSEAIARFLLDEVIAAGQREQAPGRDIDVEGFLDRASKRADDALANQPRRNARVHDAIAEGYQSLGLYQKGEREWSETLRLERSLSPPDRKNVAAAMNDVARMLSYQGKHQEAVSLLQDLLPEQRRLFGESHEEVAHVMVRLGWSLSEIGETEDAEALIGQGLAMCRVTLPDGHWLTAEAEGVLGATLTAQRRYRDAESLLLRSYKALASAPGESDDAKGTMPRRTAQILRWIIELYDSWEKPEKADDWRRRLAALSDDDPGPPAR
jgi:tetratricopeptide (TPR) repeat protein